MKIKFLIERLNSDQSLLNQELIKFLRSLNREIFNLKKKNAELEQRLEDLEDDMLFKDLKL